LRLVLDTNVVVRGLASESSAAAKVISAAEQRRFVTLLSRSVVAEYAAVLTDPDLCERFPSLSGGRVGVTLARLRFVGDYLRRISPQFAFPRDQRDAKFIELAIAGRATHIVSCDQDLLSLPIGRTDAARRFRQRLPGVQALEPGDFLARLGAQLELNAG
jgi:putative PIN family toxin of toxin-antitoxin system